MDMNWAHIHLLLFIPFILSISYAQEADVTETTTLESSNVSNDVPSSSDSQVPLDSNLRNALLKALSELEGDDGGEAQELENDEQNIAKAQASAVTYVAKDELAKISTSEEQQSNAKSIENQISTTIQRTASESQEDSSENNLTEKASEVLVQKSHAIQSVPITAIERKPLDFFKDAEQIITSASNSFITQNVESIGSPHTPRSINDPESHSKISTFSNLNTIKDFESKPSIKEVDESPFVKTYIRPLGNFVDNDVAYVKSSETANIDANSKSSVTSEVKITQNEDFGVKSNKLGGNIEATTIAAVAVSTEESEAKVEQVQFFSAPLVAAFTVHQDEKGQPKKVEPIFKNDLNPTKGPSSVQQILPQKIASFQTPTFNNVELQKKQQILEQELEKLRNQQLLQQQNLLTRNNIGSNSASNNPAFTQSSFNQAIKQNFNQFDPIFTEPDRSVVTKLATIDPSTLLSHNGGPLLNKFTLNDAMLPFGNPAKPVLQNTKSDISLIPSITLNPIIQSGTLPLNAQVLPNKEPTGFRSFVPNAQNIRPQIQSSLASLPNRNIGQNLNFVQSNSVQPQPNLIRPGQNLAQPNQNFIQSNSNLIQPSIGNFVGSTGQNNDQTLQNFNLLRNQAVQTPSNNFLGFNNVRGQSLRQNNQFLTSNRILRQEQGSANVGSNQQSFSIVPSQQLKSTHELSYFPENKRFLNQNQAQPQSNFVRPSSNLGFQSAQNSFSNDNSQNQNRLFRANLEGSVGNQNSFNIQQSVQPSQQQIFNNNPQNNRFFRSNQEGSLATSLNFGNAQNIGLSQSQIDQNNRFLRSNQESTFLNSQNRFAIQPTVQNYKYSSSFGFPTIPLNKK